VRIITINPQTRNKYVPWSKKQWGAVIMQWGIMIFIGMANRKNLPSSWPMLRIDHGTPDTKTSYDLGYLG